jgi:hypothetical protein
MLADADLLCSAVLAGGICCAALELQNGSNFELLLKEATECYKLGDYNRALALCQPVSMGKVMCWQQWAAASSTHWDHSGQRAAVTAAMSPWGRCPWGHT